MQAFTTEMRPPMLPWPTFTPSLTPFATPTP
jgi:hypothetical protein